MMEDYRWKTEEAHSTNSGTMCDYVQEHMPEEHYLVVQDGSYMEFYDTKGNLWEAHAMGDGDFNNHRIKFNRVY
jgi:hypothetical protein